MRKFATGFVEQSLEGEAAVGQATLQSARTQSQLPGDVLNRRALTGEHSLEHTFHLVTDGQLRAARVQFRIELRAEHREQLRIMRDEWTVEVAGTEDQRIAS